jgi:glyoxylase-like metal-dependent hydrolase (beta-lactamase superfamily II)
MDILKITGVGFDSNIYLIPGQRPAIVDTGTGQHSEYVIEKIKSYLLSEQEAFIILTHEHFDHCGGITSLKTIYKNPQICLHEKCAEAMESNVTWSCSPSNVMKAGSITLLRDGDFISVGKYKLEVLYTPGHSLGSICLYEKTSRSLISGDTVFSHGGFGRTDLQGGKKTDLISSIDKLRKLDVLDLYPGHGPHILQQGNHHINMAFNAATSLL